MERLSMRKIREYLRLRFEGGLSHRQIAASLQVSRSSVGEYARRFATSGLSGPLPDTVPGRSSSSTMPGTRWRSSIRPAGRSAPLHWGPPARHSLPCLNSLIKFNDVTSKFK